jgi:hypothetical protein
MRSYFSIMVLLAVSAICQSATADEPIYSLDQLNQHPYRFVPAFGHASQNPGSPKYFVPGYGYQIPGFGSSPRSLPTLTSYNDLYEFGQRKHGSYDSAGNRFWSNSYGGPWYQPGSWANTTDRWPSR